ncbi:MAG: elongation factor 4 [Candidatus Moranbacteria bacterium]|nr:elongation factor 4 [Candidatus Moranbacteria bacterium]
MNRLTFIRNFCIIAHIDHGKSTLADRLLEHTHTVEDRKMKEQLLDQMDLERERGITIKLQPVKMHYELEGEIYVLNLIDTPGHVDFQYEVSRSLSAVEGAILLVDATKGVQAQTLSNLYFALEHNLEIIPVVNKIDLPNAQVEKTKKEIIHLLGCKEEDILCASGKTGEGVKEILEKIIQKVPCPKGKTDEIFRAMIFDSQYDDYKGVIAYIRVVDGTIRSGEKIIMMATKNETEAGEVGVFTPTPFAQGTLETGSIGYIATGLKSIDQCRVGDTITLVSAFEKVMMLEGYREVQPMVFASFYPSDGEDYNAMRESLGKLKLNDAAFSFEPESNPALGRGFRCGFLGMLHLEIIRERLFREYNFDPTVTTPSVVYRIMKTGSDEFISLYSPLDYPDPSEIEITQEPYVKLEIVTPQEYVGSVMDITTKARGSYINTEYLDETRVVLQFENPLSEIIVNFHDDLKSISSGFASMHYETIGYRQSELVKLDILVAGDLINALSRIVPRERAHSEGKRLVEKLKEALPKQSFAIAIQAAVGGKILARETISPFRKDVIAKLYGGDITRKRKLLEKQKRGKKKMASMGRVTIPSETFLAILKK